MGFPSVGKKTATKTAAPQKKSGFSFGSKKTVQPKKSSGSILSFGSKKTAQPKKIVAEPVAPAQSFVIRIPGQFFQSKKDIVWPVTLGFTKSNELFVGRMAMLGFASSLIGEILTGNGPLAQFDIETGLPLFDTEPLVLGLAAFNLFAAFAPGKGKFIPDVEETTARPAPARAPSRSSTSRPASLCLRPSPSSSSPSFFWEPSPSTRELESSLTRTERACLPRQ